MARPLGRLILLAASLGAAAPTFARSYYTARPDDPGALTLTREAFGARGDGVADDAPALQKAIDTLQETKKQGVLFVPEGRYRLGGTVYVWSGIRLIGYGARRPVLVLGERTPGFQDGTGKYMVHFVSWRPRPGEAIRDANPGTFYSAMSNIDVEIGAGNPAAIGVRFHVAQHCTLAHMDLRIGSGRAGLEDIGNFAGDLRFEGGDYGIVTRKTSPSWPFVLIDSSFEGQRQAAIRTEEAGLTLVRDRFRRVPTAVSINPERPEQLWIKDSRFEDVSGPALVVGNEANARTQVNAENLVCARVPVFLRFRESGKELAGAGPIYVVKDLSHGLQIADVGGAAAVRTTYDAAPLERMPAPVPSDVPPLPAQETWVDLRSLGAKGDGASDDTAVLQKAIDENRAVYLPSGRYRVSDTIRLRADTVLIGLSPIATVIALDDATPAFQGPGAPKPLLEAPKGGTTIVAGIGLDTGGNNGRAVAAKWMAGAGSLMDDVRFLGGHGTYRLDGTWEEIHRSWQRIYDATHSADPDPKRRWDSQYASLWVTDGGGGVFKDIWTPSTFAQAGLYVSNTSTPGRIYAMSIEHHVRNEAIFRNASNWEVYALQTEEERGESRAALPLEVTGSSRLTFANLFAYRVVSSDEPFPQAVKVTDSRDVRFRGLHVYSDSKVAFDAAVLEATQGIEVRSYELARLTLSGDPPRPAPRPPSRVLAPGALVERLAGGFHNIAGATVDAEGDLYFVDARRQAIYRWAVAERALSLVRDAPLDPVQLAFDKAGDLIVVSSAGKGTVFSFRPGSSEEELRQLVAEPAAARPGAVPLLAVNRWRHRNDFAESATERRPHHYVSPDGSAFIPAGEDFVTGALYYGAKMADVLRAFRLAPAVPGRPFYACDESGLRTYRFSVGPDGTLSDPALFAEEGGSGTAVDGEGRVYIAAEQVSVYDSSGSRIEAIEVPERPTSLLFGGPDRRTLFILTRRSLYAVRMREEGGSSPSGQSR